MRLTLPRNQILFLSTLFAACLTLGSGKPALAQIESIDPNPTMPFDMARELGEHSGSSYGGARFGRGPAEPGQAREQNPAETMLRDIEGSHYGRHTGHAIFPPARENHAGGGRKSLPTHRPSAAARRSSTAATVAPRGGRPENRWRYHFFRGRWWYLADDGGWSYFNGRRWATYPSSAASGSTAASPPHKAAR